MGNWLKGCEICNAGFCEEFKKLVEKKNMSERKAARLLAEEAKKKIGEEIYSEDQLRRRYRYHTMGLKVGQNVPKDVTPEQLKYLVEDAKNIQSASERRKFIQELTKDRTPEELSDVYGVPIKSVENWGGLDVIITGGNDPEQKEPETVKIIHSDPEQKEVRTVNIIHSEPEEKEVRTVNIIHSDPEQKEPCKISFIKPEDIKLYKRYAMMAIAQLEGIDPNDREGKEALNYVLEWINKRLKI